MGSLVIGGVTLVAGNLIADVLLILLYLTALLADFLAPYPLDFSDRTKFYHPPTILHLRDAHGRWHLRPFVYNTRLADPGLRIFTLDRSARYPVRFFVRGEPRAIRAV